jgi:ribonucleotide monophosphatase NagD (HAD superfamily)
MHNGARAFDAAGEACRKFRAAGGIVVLLSNAPRPFSAVVGQMTALGVDPAAYDGGVTSGDATRGLIEAWAGRSLLHIGPVRDRGLFDGLGVKLATAEAAQGSSVRALRRHPRVPADCAALFDRLAAAPAD